MRFLELGQWLAWQETLHPKSIDLGLERCQVVATRMGLDILQFPVVTVSGTNGKGSCIALLAAIWQAAGYRVGAYTSPHLHRYNERVCVAGSNVSDNDLVEAFAVVDEARGEVSLTYFEFGTLAAVWLLKRYGVEVALLEVGLGGRLDAVNVFDSDVALLTSIGLDHIDWLGSDIDQIGREKAGIFRAGHPAVVADPTAPESVAKCARWLEAKLFRSGQEFTYQWSGENWRWCSAQMVWEQLPIPALLGPHQLQNAAAALMVVELLGGQLSVNREAIDDGLRGVTLNARQQLFPGDVLRVIDVAHNPHAAERLRDGLALIPCCGKTRAVFASLSDKDTAGIVSVLMGTVDDWYVADAPAPRGSAGASLAQVIRALGAGSRISEFGTVKMAYLAALKEAELGDRVVCFGSFHAAGQGLEIETEALMMNAVAVGYLTDG